MTEGTENSEKSFEHLFQGDEWDFPVDIAIAHPAADEIRRRMERAGWPDEELMMVDVAIEEAIKNAFIHGTIVIGPLPEDKSKAEVVQQKLAAGVPEKLVHVSVLVSPDEVRIRVRDEGEGFDWKKVADPLLPENLLKNAGRGIFFMKTGFDAVEYNEKGNEVTLIKKRKSSKAVSAPQNGQ
ncbi:MAG: hypothetical protein RL681_274 [Candidatus Parcubacteria bacterium]|jgi:anti-sigma regulatory factor (Ser/Thr protein kinase)